jgi:hypothetical protein
MATDDLFKKVPGLKRKVRKYRNLTNTNWLERAYKDKFEIQDGRVRLKGAAPPPPPLPQPAAKPAAKKKTDFAALRAIYGNKPMNVK